MISNRTMRMKLTEQQIKKIAGSLDAGMRCFYNLKTGEIEETFKEEDMDYVDDYEDLWGEKIDHIEENWDEYIEFNPMDSSDGFKVMERFVERVDDSELQYRLRNALDKRKPFSNFKHEVDNSGPYRQMWFDFKLQAMVEYVKLLEKMHHDENQDLT